jgi:hypothetical protein
MVRELDGYIYVAICDAPPLSVGSHAVLPHCSAAGWKIGRIGRAPAWRWWKAHWRELRTSSLRICSSHTRPMRRARVWRVLGHALEVLLDKRGKRHLEGTDRPGYRMVVAVVMMVMWRGLRLWQRPEGIRLQRVGGRGGLHWAEGVWWDGHGPWSRRWRRSVSGRQLAEDEVEALVLGFAHLSGSAMLDMTSPTQWLTLSAPNTVASVSASFAMTRPRYIRRMRSGAGFEGAVSCIRVRNSWIVVAAGKLGKLRPPCSSVDGERMRRLTAGTSSAMLGFAAVDLGDVGRSSGGGDVAPKMKILSPRQAHDSHAA